MTRLPTTAGREAVLTDEDDNPLAVVEQAPRSGKLLLWKGQVFEHWAGVRWRRVPVVRVEATEV